MTPSPTTASLLTQLDGVRPNGSGWIARCPGHDDQHASLSIHEGDDGRVLLKCFAGCETERIVAALGRQMRDLFPPNGRGGGGAYPYQQHCNPATPHGCTLADYAAAKRPPIDRLRAFGLSEISYLGAPAIRVPYRDPSGMD